MVVLTVAQRKGGAGKTTLAANLAVAASGARRVALLDIDPQQSLARWHALRAARGAPGLSFSNVSGWRLPAELERLGRAHDLLIVDTPPQIDTDARVAIRAATLVLAPVQPSAPDLWAAADTLRLAAEERRPARIVLNRAPAGGKLRADIEAEIERLGYPRLPTALGNRAGVASAFAAGLGIGEAAPKSVAAAELRALWADIGGILAWA